MELAVRTERKPGEIETERVTESIPDYCFDFVFFLDIYYSRIFIGGLPHDDTDGAGGRLLAVDTTTRDQHKIKRHDRTD